MRIRRSAGLWLALFLLAVLAVLVPQRAWAHGALKRSRPAARDTLHTVPRELRLEFTEAPELAVSTLRLTDADGHEIALSPLRTVPDSARILVADIPAIRSPGRYTVHWQIAGADGHPVRGEFRFVVAPGAEGLTPPPQVDSAPRAPAAAATEPPAPMIHVEGFGAESVAYVLVRWAQFLGLVIVIGAVAFHFLVLGALRRGDAGSPVAMDAAPRVAAIAALGALLLAVSSAARLVAQSAALGTGTYGGMVMGTTWGHAWMLQVAGISLLTVALLMLRRRQAGVPWMLAAVAALVLALSTTLASHAGASGSSLAIAADLVHLVAAGGWMGGLAMLVLAGFPASRAGAGAGAAERMARLVNAFSPTAIGFTFLLLLTGVAASWRNLESFAALTGSTYGRVLMLKLLVLAVAAGIGFYNWRRAHARLAASADDAAIRRSMRAELAAGVVILLITAVLVAIPTPADAALR